MMMKKFKMIRTLAYVMRGIGWLVFVGGIAFSVLVLVSPAMLTQYGVQVTQGSAGVAAIGALLVSVLYTILFLAVAEQLMLFISLEENLRQLREFFTSDKK